MTAASFGSQKWAHWAPPGGGQILRVSLGRDGAPILHRDWDGRRIPVYPHLATLSKGGWRTFDMAGTQRTAGQVADLSLPPESQTHCYVHTEQLRVLCKTCWERESHGKQHDNVEHRVVTGRLVVPPNADLNAIGQTLTEIAGAADQPTVYVPELWAHLGQPERSDVEQRRYDMLLQARRTG